MKLRDLDAVFVGRHSVGEHSNDNFFEQSELDGAQGVLFDCPLCQKHSVLCWFNNPINAPQVPDSACPAPGRWAQSGTGIDDLTLSPSVNLDVHPEEHSMCRWHGWVQNGEAK